jgi:hypothetical protein
MVPFVGHLLSCKAEGKCCEEFSEDLVTDRRLSQCRWTRRRPSLTKRSGSGLVFFMNPDPNVVSLALLFDKKETKWRRRSHASRSLHSRSMGTLKPSFSGQKLRNLR